jgi:hypothetical protein
LAHLLGIVRDEKAIVPRGIMVEDDRLERRPSRAVLAACLVLLVSRAKLEGRRAKDDTLTATINASK